MPVKVQAKAVRVENVFLVRALEKRRMPKIWKRKPEILMLPNIPEPLHGINPRTVLGGPWWNKERRAAYASTNFRCEACGRAKLALRGRKILEGHEVYHTDYQAGRLTYLRTTPLCPDCHRYIHDGRLTWLLETGQISSQTYVRIIRHGDAILRAEGLIRPSLQERRATIAYLLGIGQCAPWEKWRLVVNGNEYKPRPKNAETS